MPKQIGNRSYLDGVDEIVAPEHTALIVVDMQNDYFHEGGYYEKLGIDLSMIHAIVPPTQRLLEAARSAGVFVVYSMHTIMPGFRSDSDVWLGIHARAGLKSLDQEDFYCLDGSWGQQIVDELDPQRGDHVMKKYRSNCFVGTELDTLMRSNGLRTLVATGQVTNGCVENTVRMARDIDYHAVLVRDAVASTNEAKHDATMTNLGDRLPSPTADELVRTWTI